MYCLAYTMHDVISVDHRSITLLLKVIIFFIYQRSVQFWWVKTGSLLAVVQLMTYTLQICCLMFTCLINIQNANYSLTTPHIYYELSVVIPLSMCYRHLTCVNISLNSCLLATDRIYSLVFIGVDVRLQYFLPYRISVNIIFFLLLRCCSMFWQNKRKWLH